MSCEIIAAYEPAPSLAALAESRQDPIRDQLPLNSFDGESPLRGTICLEQHSSVKSPPCRHQASDRHARVEFPRSIRSDPIKRWAALVSSYYSY